MSGTGQKNQFVKRLMVAKCDCGNMQYQYLNLPLDHGVYFQDVEQPLMNANDHDGDRNILQFGRCTSDKNPKNKLDSLISSAVASNALLKAVDTFADKAKEALGCEGCKCNPIILNSWNETDEANRLDGAPAITNKSKVYCQYGGIITITEKPQEETNDDNNTDDVQNQEEPEKHPLDTIPSAMKDKINNGNEELMQDMEQWYEENAEDFAQMYGVSESVTEQNYMNNRTEMINPSSLNEEGFISDASWLYNFNIGGSNVAGIGSCCAASYNLFQALDMPMPMCDIIRQTERTQTVSGFMDMGPMAVSLMAMSQRLTGMGLSTCMVCGDSMYEAIESINIGEAGILGVSAGGSAEFCTLKTNAEGMVYCAEKPEASIEELCKIENGKPKAFLKAAVKPISMVSKEIRSMSISDGAVKPVSMGSRAIQPISVQHKVTLKDKGVKNKADESGKIYSI